jgi:hypothetical protein
VRRCFSMSPPFRPYEGWLTLSRSFRGVQYCILRHAGALLDFRQPPLLFLTFPSRCCSLPRFRFALLDCPSFLYRHPTEAQHPVEIDTLRAVEKRDPNQCVLPFLIFPFSSHSLAPSSASSDWLHDPSMPHPIDAPGSQFERAHSSAESSSPIVDRHRPSSLSSHHGPVIQDSYQLGRVRTDRSMTHDMSQGGRATPGHGSGYAFDEGVALDVRFSSLSFPSFDR